MTAPPPFQPFRPMGTDARENAIAFLGWTADALFRIHALSEANVAYSKATYQAVVGAQRGKRPVARAVRSQPAPIPMDEVLYDFGRQVVQNRETVAAFLKMFLK